MRTHGASKGATSTCPPSSAARSAIASASSTPNVTPQYAELPASSSGMGTRLATTSSKRSGAPIAAISSRMPGRRCSRKSPYAASAHMLPSPTPSSSHPKTAP